MTMGRTAGRRRGQGVVHQARGHGLSVFSASLTKSLHQSASVPCAAPPMIWPSTRAGGREHVSPRIVDGDVAAIGAGHYGTGPAGRISTSATWQTARGRWRRRARAEHGDLRLAARRPPPALSASVAHRRARRSSARMARPATTSASVRLPLARGDERAQPVRRGRYRRRSTSAAPTAAVELATRKGARADEGRVARALD